MSYLATASNRIYFAQSGGHGVPGGIYWIDRAGGNVHMLTEGGVGYWSVAVDDTTVYFTNQACGTVNAVAR